MKVLITGAGGFLGSHIAKLLIARGDQVINLSRSNYPELEKLGVKCLQADLADFPQVENIFKEVGELDAVIHVAAKAGVWGRFDSFYKPNVVGTKNIIDCCQQFKIPKLIYTSSPSVVFGKEDLCGADESTPYPRKYYCHYAKTKAMAEQAVLGANSQELATVALRPHLIFGPGDPNLIPRIVAKAKAGRLRIVGEGDNTVDVIHVSNAAKAHLQALDKLSADSKLAGKAYFIGQEKPVKLWPFINEVLKIHKLAPVQMAVSAKLAFRMGRLMEWAYMFLKIYDREPPMTRFVALQLSKDHYFSHKAAENDFGYHPEISIKDAILTTQV